MRGVRRSALNKVYKAKEVHNKIMCESRHGGLTCAKLPLERSHSSTSKSPIVVKGTRGYRTPECVQVLRPRAPLIVGKPGTRAKGLASRCHKSPFALAPGSLSVLFQHTRRRLRG